MAKPKSKRVKKIKAKSVVEPLECIWEKHLQKEHRTECPYQDDAKAYENSQLYPLTTFPKAVCKYCQSQRKVLALEGIDFNLGEIEMCLSTGGLSIDVMGIDSDAIDRIQETLINGMLALATQRIDMGGKPDQSTRLSEFEVKQPSRRKKTRRTKQSKK